MVDQEEPETALEKKHERGPNPHLRTLELARIDIVRRLESATNANHKKMLERALADLDDQIRRTDPTVRRHE